MRQRLLSILRSLGLVARGPSVAEVLARAQARPGGAESDAVVTAVRAGRDRD
jgi:hypothetical protein